LRKLEITVVRTPYTYDCPAAGGGGGCNTDFAFDRLDTVAIKRWVPVLGEFEPNGAHPPKTETVSTGMNMVFNVLHGR
jgi:hypothetical protein